MTGFEPTSLSRLAEQYECFLVDQYGVLRDADGLYPGAREAMVQLRQAGRTVIILSNSGQDEVYNARRLAVLGIGPDAYTAFVTSGDVALAQFESATPPVPLHPGDRCLTITSGDRVTIPQRLGLQAVETGEDADLVLIAGSSAETVGMDTYAAKLRPAAARGVKAVCTNPDLEKLTAHGTAPGAGAIAALYEEMGGTVIHIGKPHAAIYAHAHALAGYPPKERMVCIGDSLRHDVKGADGFGIDAVLVGTGIAAGMGRADLAGLAAGLGCVPRWFMADGFLPDGAGRDPA